MAMGANGQDTGSFDAGSPEQRLAAQERLAAERGVGAADIDPTDEELAGAYARAQQGPLPEAAPAAAPAAEAPAATAPQAAMGLAAGGGAVPPERPVIGEPGPKVTYEGTVPFHHHSRTRPFRMMLLGLGALGLAFAGGALLAPEKEVHAPRVAMGAPTEGIVGALAGRTATPEAFEVVAARAAAGAGMSEEAVHDSLLSHLAQASTARREGTATPVTTPLAGGLSFVTTSAGAGETQLVQNDRTLGSIDWSAVAGPTAAIGMDAAPTIAPDALWNRAELLFAYRGIEVDQVKGMRGYVEGEVARLQRFQEQSQRDPNGARASNSFVDPTRPYCNVTTGSPPPGLGGDYPQVVYRIVPGQPLTAQLRMFDPTSGESRIVAHGLTREADLQRQTQALRNGTDDCAVQARVQARTHMQAMTRR